MTLLVEDRWRRRMEARLGTTVLRSDPYLEAEGGRGVEFRLTYAGDLLAHREGRRYERSLHVHSIRKQFHKQLAALWSKHPTLSDIVADWQNRIHEIPVLKHDGFNWLPLVRLSADTICKLEILMLREGQPGSVLYDIDNRLKTSFDALKKPENPEELGARSSQGQQIPAADEDPFFVLVEKDSLITHVAVTSDTLLEPVPNCLPESAVRLVINVTVQTYKTHVWNIHFN